MEFFNEPIRDLIAKNVDIDKDFRYEQFKVGRSNITFKVFDKENTYVLRRPPYGNKLESAHNMSREYKIIDELSKNISLLKIKSNKYNNRQDDSAGLLKLLNGHDFV